MTAARLKAYFYFLIVSVLWGIAGPVIKLTLSELPPDVFVLYRFFISSVIALFLFTLKPFRLPKKGKLLATIFLFAFLNTTVTLGLLFWGTAKTTLLDMSLISLFGPLMAVIAGYVFLRERVTLQEKIGVFIAFLGSATILIEPLLKIDNGRGEFSGNILVLSSLVVGVTSGVLLKKILRENVNPIGLANFSFLVGFATLLPIVLATRGLGNTLTAVTRITFPYHLGVFYMAIFSGSIAYSLLNKGQKTIELSEAALFSYLYPIISATLAVVLLGDKLTPVIVGGSVVTFIGVIIAEYKRKTKRLKV